MSIIQSYLHYLTAASGSIRRCCLLVVIHVHHEHVGGARVPVLVALVRRVVVEAGLLVPVIYKCTLLIPRRCL